MMVWSYAAALVMGMLAVALGYRLQRSKRKNRINRIDVGPLSDSWLAERRSQRDTE